MQIRSHELLPFVRYKLSLYVSLYYLLITLLTVPLSEGQSAITDGFNYPIGPRNPGFITEDQDNDGWYNAQDYGVENTDIRLNGLHAGEDWNDSCLDSSDVGAPVYAIANGEVVDFRVVIGASSGLSIGQVLVLKHTLPDGHPQGKNLYSLYLHIDVSVELQKEDPVTRDQQIGTIANVTTLPPHLHFELRTKSIDLQTLWPADTDDIPNNAYYSSISDMDKDGILNPSIFLDTNRPSNDTLETGRIPSTFIFERDLERGMCRYEIRYLQIVLNSDPDTMVAESGPGSPENETSEFGILTEDAVKRFQEKYLRVAEGTGRVDAETRVQLNNILSAKPLDLAFVIDTTTSMHDDIDAVKASATQMIEEIDSKISDYRIALVTYKDYADTPLPTQTHLDFSSDSVATVAAIQALTLSGGGQDIPEDVYSGVMHALKLLSWRNDSEREIIVMGDAPPHDPEPVTGLTEEDVINAANGVELIDFPPSEVPLIATRGTSSTSPTSINTILIGNDAATRASFSNLSQGTDGQFFEAANADDVVDTIIEAIGAIIDPTPTGAAFAYITQRDANTVSIIDLITNQIVTTLPVGIQPIGVAVSPEGHTIYISNRGSNTLSLIDALTNLVTATIPVGPFPEGIAVHPNNGTVYISHRDSTTIGVMNSITQEVSFVEVAPPVAPEEGGRGVLIHPSGNPLYVVIRETNSVVVVDTSTLTVIGTIPVGRFADWGAINPQGTKVYIANREDNTISVIDTLSNQIVDTIPVGRNPLNIAVHPDGTHIYVANGDSNDVTVVDATTHAIRGVIPVGENPIGIDIHPDGTLLYTTNRDNNTVSIINTSSLQVVETIPVSGAPVSFGRFIGVIR